MIGALTRFLRKSASDRRNASYQLRVKAINALEAELAALPDLELSARTTMFRYEVAGGGKSLDDILVPAFAIVREAAKRTLGLRLFDAQLLGGMALHDGHIAEIATGEGKTLIATLPAYLNALAGRGVHVITVNDYLSKRDAEWMGRIYEFLGLSIGTIKHGLDDTARRAAYACDITYGTSAEFGFDYLRDNMKYRQVDMVQRGHFHAIVDEADSILIDEARTPLVISGPSEQSSDLYITIDVVVSELSSGDYEVDEKLRIAPLTRNGIDKVEHLLSATNLMKSGSLFDIENISLLHHVNQALIAHKLFKKDRDYIVHNGEAIIVDEVTGRMLLGRRHADGLHQAVEAREHLEIRPENRTLASVTIQNYFRMYEKLSGMTGTALTEAAELSGTYRTDVVAVPPHKLSLRDDQNDEIYRTEAEKLRAVCAIIEDCRQRGQPILVGTTSIEKSEQLAGLLCERGWERRDFERRGSKSKEAASQKPFALLNARHHEQEAYIIAQAGIPGAVTIATNMAGRGVDIQLGGNVEMRIHHELADLAGDACEKRAEEIRRQAAMSKQQALAAGGLFVLGTERHESRRIDNQLRGRAGRQGDPGRSKFLVSLEDDLLRGPGSGRFDRLRKSPTRHDGRLAAHSLIGKAVNRAQQRIEARNLSNRQNMLRFDDVLNDQRKIVFDQRLALMEDDRISDVAKDMRHGFVEDLVRQHLSSGSGPASWDWENLDLEVRNVLTLDVPVSSWREETGTQAPYVRDYIASVADRWMAGKVERWGDSRMRVALRRIVIALLDDLWLRHVSDLEMLRRAAPLRAHGRRDPLVEFKIEAFELFEQMLCRLRRNVTAATMRLGFEDDIPTQPIETEEEHEVLVPDHLVNALH